VVNSLKHQIIKKMGSMSLIVTIRHATIVITHGYREV
jgi:butyrate kinase